MYRRIAPPTSLANAEEVLKLEDKFAAGRKFADDDPKEELKNNGIVEADFTDKKAWDLFPAAQNLLRIWDICEDYVKAFVANTYPTDATVAADTELQTWMANAAKPDHGNIRGLPELKNRTALIGLLTSQLYRLTAHGVSRLQRSTDPWLTFVANFPPCLQRVDLPSANSSLSTQELLKYLPNVRTIADTLVFYYAFAYSKPYTPLIPKKGSDDELEFPGGRTDPRNKALIEYRDKLKEFIIDYTAAQNPAGYEFARARTEAVAAVAKKHRNISAFAPETPQLERARRHSIAGGVSPPRTGAGHQSQRRDLLSALAGGSLRQST